MKVVIISFAFFESTLPLVKELSRTNEITLFSVFSKTFLNPPNFDISKEKEVKSGALLNANDILTDKHYLKKYFKDSVFNFKIAAFDNNPISTFLLVWKMKLEIRKNKPEIIHFIGDHPFLYVLHHLLRNEKTVHTFHEIAFERIKNNATFNVKEYMISLLQKRRLALCLKYNSQLIFHSKNISRQFYNVFKYENVSVIPFGLFDIYRYQDEIKHIIPKGTVLFFGYIRLYKGADVFVKAIKEFNEKFQNKKVNFVIAGKNAKILNSLNLPENLILIDKFLTDAELASMIKQSKLVVVPHRVASQSGIPNTCYALCKPVICSNIEGLNEIIVEGKNGLLFESENSTDLADKIYEILENEIKYNTMNDYILNDNTMIKSWSNIAMKTVQTYSLALTIDSNS